MSEQKNKIPLSLKLSFVFIFIAIAVFVAMLMMMINAPDGLAGGGVGWAAMAIIILVSVPACMLAFITGLFAIAETQWAYLTVIPSGLVTVGFLVWFSTLGG